MKNSDLGRVPRLGLVAAFLLLFLAVAPMWSLEPVVCVGNTTPLGAFNLQVAPPKGGPPLPIGTLNRIQAHDKLLYTPANLPPEYKNKAKVAIIVVPADGGAKSLGLVLKQHPANQAAQWTVPVDASIVGLVFGPHGFDQKKVESLVLKNPDLLVELAHYSRQTNMVNALVQTISQYEQSAPGSEDLSAALEGFSSRYNVMLPTLAPGMATSQQATVLLQSMVPSLSSYDPRLSGKAAALQQSTSLATTLGMVFYGTPVGLAAGGAALVQNLATAAFPGTAFRAAFTEAAGGNLKMCTPNQPPTPRKRLAYLWMLKVPGARPPEGSVVGTPSIALGSVSPIKVTAATQEQLGLLNRARSWQLISGHDKVTIPVEVKNGKATDTLSLDLTHAKLAPGSYHLAGLWDWHWFKLDGQIALHPYADFSRARLTSDSADKLMAGSGPLVAQLTGADFEFVKRVAIRTPGDDPFTEPQKVPFTLTKGLDGGIQPSMTLELNPEHWQPGPYSLLLTQTNGKTQTVPVTVHPPNPVVSNLPLRANLGETDQTIVLEGTNLDLIQSLTSPGTTWALAPPSLGAQASSERIATVRLQPGVHAGQVLDAQMKIAGIDQPVDIPQFLHVVGPRPKIFSVKESFGRQNSVELDPGEIPAGNAASFAIRTANVGARPVLALGCKDSADTLQALRLQPGSDSDGAQLDYAGSGTLFLSLDPGTVGRSGCVLTAQLINPNTGSSDPYALGRVVRLPRIDKFSISDQKAGPSLYEGTLTGQDLQTIEKTGWNSQTGYPIEGIPTPLPGNPQEQTLEIALPWPPPAPHAPVYVWVRGEKQGRKTTAKYY